MSASLLKTSLETAAQFTSDVAVHISTDLEDWTRQERSVHMVLPKATLVILLAVEAFTPVVDDHFFTASSKAHCNIPLSSTTYLNQTTTSAIGLELDTSQFGANQKIFRILILLRALFTSGTTVDINFLVPFQNPKISTVQNIGALSADNNQEVLLRYVLSHGLWF